MALITRSLYRNKSENEDNLKWVLESTDTYHDDSGNLFISLLANKQNLVLSPSQDENGIRKIILINPNIPNVKIEYLISEQDF